MITRHVLRFIRPVFAAAMIGAFAGLTSPLQAASLSSAQSDSMSSCLVSCTKGDTDCQNGCAAKAAGESFVNASGACVRACADALVMPGQADAVKSDLKQCLAACK